MKRATALFITALLTIGLLAGCSQQQDGGGAHTTAQTSGKVEEVFYFNTLGNISETLPLWFNEWNDTVGAEKGIKIKWETDIQSGSATFEAMMQAGNYPDMFTWTSNCMRYASAGYLKDLRTINDNEVQAILDEYAQYSINGYNCDGDSVYTILTDIIPCKFVINDDIFIECGLTDANGKPTPPKTLAEFVEYAKIITDHGNGVYYGVGLSGEWSIGTVRRFMLKASIASTGVGWFNTNTNQYDFTPFRPVIDAYRQIVADGSAFLGWETIGIDPIRAQFADGNVGMMVAPGYDIAVYTDQFPAKCEWSVHDFPNYDGNPQYKGVGWACGGEFIISKVSDERLPSVAEVWKWMDSKEWFAKKYSMGGYYPLDPSVIELAKKNYDVLDIPQFTDMADLTNYMPVATYPDAMLTLDGEEFKDVIVKIIKGEVDIDEGLADLNERYNAAYQEGLQDGTVNESYFHYDYSYTR